jgi:cytidyltransferase-like protein
MKHSNASILPISEVAHLREELLSKGKSIGLCHGCFDVLHFGHLIHLNEAASVVDVLFLSLTPDIFVNKGPTRPIFSETKRSFFLSNIRCIDFIFVNDSETAINALLCLKPHVYFKGADYANSISEGYLMEQRLCSLNGIKLLHTKGDRFSSTEVLARFKE